jgi:hypothetical protein
MMYPGARGKGITRLAVRSRARRVRAARSCSLSGIHIHRRVQAVFFLISYEPPGTLRLIEGDELDDLADVEFMCGHRGALHCEAGSNVSRNNRIRPRGRKIDQAPDLQKWRGGK